MNELDDTERLTASMVQQITEAMRRRGIKQAHIAERLGIGKPWVSKLLGGQTKTIKRDHLEALCEVLEINLMPGVGGPCESSPMARKWAAMIDSDPAMMRFAQAFDEIMDKQAVAGIPFIPTQDMTRIGQEIIRLCFANENKAGKVAREVLKMLSEEIASNKKNA
jgi:DNA-binding Xre family transcriptional regulator